MVEDILYLRVANSSRGETRFLLVDLLSGGQDVMEIFRGYLARFRSFRSTCVFDGEVTNLFVGILSKGTGSVLVEERLCCRVTCV